MITQRIGWACIRSCLWTCAERAGAGASCSSTRASAMQSFVWRVPCGINNAESWKGVAMAFSAQCISTCRAEGSFNVTVNQAWRWRSASFERILVAGKHGSFQNAIFRSQHGQLNFARMMISSFDLLCITISLHFTRSIVQRTVEVPQQSLRRNTNPPSLKPCGQSRRDYSSPSSCAAIDCPCKPRRCERPTRISHLALPFRGYASWFPHSAGLQVAGLTRESWASSLWCLLAYLRVVRQQCLQMSWMQRLMMMMEERGEQWSLDLLGIKSLLKVPRL
jgi:hypothetical protein